MKKVLRGGSDITTNEKTLSLVLQWLFYFKSVATYAQKFIVDILPGITLKIRHLGIFAERNMKLGRLNKT